ncbi:uncharacterized protein LOC141534064 [Cotesia typhae]|uniref:uncharacterized protein LOC141534064 n=1 Tax=Cotesia typhae TaxID=2053667 RepID=UPI003D68D2A4
MVCQYRRVQNDNYFINEYKNLREEGFEYDSHKFKVIIRAVICDSPARAFVTYTKGHGGFYGCGKCIQEGEYSDHRMLFLDMDAPLRTDSNFINRLNEDHHLGKSDFEDIGVGMMSQFPVDYMHLVRQGVSKKY